MTYIFSGQAPEGQDAKTWANSGEYAFTLTFEGPRQDGMEAGTMTLGADTVRYIKQSQWGCYTGTVTPEKGETPFDVQNNIRWWIKNTTGRSVDKILCWDLRLNKF